MSVSTARSSRRTAGPLFVAPFLLLFVLLFLAPLGYAAYLSLFEHKLIGGTTFVGLDNYVTAVKDPQLIHGVLRVATFFLIQVPVMLVLALLFALALDSGLVRLARVVRLGIFVPYAVPSVVASLMWGYLYGPDYGPFAQLSKALPVPVPHFLSRGWLPCTRRLYRRSGRVGRSDSVPEPYAAPRHRSDPRVGPLFTTVRP